MLPDKESHRPDGGEPDTWPNTMSDEVRQRVDNFQSPHRYVIGPRRPRATSLVWYAGVKVAHVDTKLDGGIFANTFDMLTRLMTFLEYHYLSKPLLVTPQAFINISDVHIFLAFHAEPIE